jgi:hypothetical protein
MKRYHLTAGPARRSTERASSCVSIFAFALVVAATILLLLSGPCDVANLDAVAATYTFYANSAIDAGDVVVWDSDVAYGVKTTNAQGADTVAGVAAETASAGNECVIRQDGGRVAVNVAGAVTRGQWLVTSATAGSAKGVADKQVGVFARAITDSGVPAAGQVYASLNLGFLGYGPGIDANSLRGRVIGAAAPANDQVYAWNAATSQWEPADQPGGATDHGALAGLGDDDHSQYLTNARGDTRYLFRDNADPFTPDADYEPATKKYVDDNAGATDHGALTGLDDDDHAQYALVAGDTYTGTHDFGGATLEIPNAADVSGVTGEGQIAWDSDDKRLSVGNGTSAQPVGFVARGDVGNDYQLGDLTTDGSWYELDLSSIVPAGAKAVVLLVQINDNAADSEIQMRLNGATYTEARMVTQVANIYNRNTFILSVPASRIVQYNLTNTTWSAVYIKVTGWFY